MKKIVKLFRTDELLLLEDEEKFKSKEMGAGLSVIDGWFKRKI
jgi:hypothetical protein